MAAGVAPQADFSSRLSRPTGLRSRARVVEETVARNGKATPTGVEVRVWDRHGRIRLQDA